MAASSKLVATIRPPRHHPHPFIPKFSAGIGPPYTVGIDMGQLPLDRVGISETAFVQHRRRGRAEAMTRHVLVLEAHATQGRVQRVLGHATRDRSDRRKQKSALRRRLSKLLENHHGARGERDPMRPPHLHSAGRNFPYRGVEIEFAPFSGPQLARANEGQGEQFECCPCLDGPLIVLDSSQQSAKRVRRHDGARGMTVGVTSAPRSAVVGSFSARAVAIA